MYGQGQSIVNTSSLGPQSFQRGSTDAEPDIGAAA